MNTNKKLFKVTAATALAILLFEVVFPVAAYALTSGPAQPEFSSFEPVATTGMVNEFSGGFTYNLPVVEIPGANGGGYALSLSYHSGATMEEEASWVGFGWTLNPGSIMRSKRGFPDDYNDQTVTYYNKTIQNVTYTVGYSVGAELFSKDFALGLSSMLRYNTYTGYSAIQSYSISSFGVASLGYSIEDGSGKFTATINPAALLKFNMKPEDKEKEEKILASYSGIAKFAMRTMMEMKKAAERPKNELRFNSASSTYGIHQLAPAPMPTNTVEYTGKSYNIRFGFHVSALPFIPGQVGGRVGLSGSYSYQKGKDKDEKKVYGYMYSGDVGSGDANSIMDYYTEKDVPFTKKDRYLGIPFSNADIFALTGEGLGGGFRLHNRRVGVFRSNSKESKTNIYDAGVDLGVGTDWGFGADVSSGRHFLRVGKWNMPNTPYQFASQTVNNKDGEPYFFRFTNDKGGKVVFSGNDNPYRASISGRIPSVNATDIDTVLNDGKRSGRSSYVAYNTIAEMKEYQTYNTKSIYYRSYTKDDATRSFIDYNDTKIQKSIGEVSVVKENGVRYVYGLPVYARNERNMQLGMGNYWIGAGKKLAITYSSWAHEDSTNVASGEVRKEPYASTYLLTLITTPDYIDRQNDGPTPDDFGGYTKFNYIRRAGTDAKSDYSGNSSREWYRWRAPYVGLSYSPGKLIDGRDDRGVVASGEKEIYYLESVETKTHIAYFITNQTDKTIPLAGDDLHLKGSGKERLDGYEAFNDDSDVKNEVKAATDPGSDDFTGYDGVWKSEFAGKKFRRSTRKGIIEYVDMDSVKTPRPNKLCYLERIELYAKNEAGEPSVNIKKVHFEYDYNLMKTIASRYIDTTKTYLGLPPDTIYNVPTSLNSAYGLTTRPEDLYSAHQTDGVAMFRHGKLTLKKVWFEYEGVVNAKISPYVFEYDYKKSYEYDALISSKYPAIVQHGINFLDSLGPDGFYALDYRDQNPTYGEHYTDRWGQYRFRHSAGGYANNYESYTRQDYEQRFDPAAWQLKVIKLPSGGEIQVQYEQHDYSYVQDRPAMSMVRLKKIDDTHLIRRYYLDIDKELDTSVVKKDQLVDVLREQFITKGEKIFFKFLYRFENCSSNLDQDEFPSGLNDFITGYTDIYQIDYDTAGVYISLKGDYTPNKLAKEYAKLNKVDNMDCNTPTLSTTDNDFQGKGFWLSVLNLLPGISLISQGIDELLDEDARPFTHFSYFRIPLSAPKKGGGIRVKRILMYDEGLEEGDAVLYGSEYIYKAQRQLGNGRVITISSGVATNEPSEGREENSLVQFLPKRDEPAWYEKLAGGDDLQQYEGPLGESILPAPSIGYSKVVVKSIHSGKTGTGFAVTEYFTAKDFPMEVRHTDVDQDGFTPNPAVSLFTNISTAKYWTAQGYSFIINGMHGQIRKIEKYGGTYEQPESWYLVEAQEFDYYKPGEKIPMLDEITNELVLDDPGKEMEIVMESREITDKYDNHALSFDAGITLPSAFLLPLPFGTFSFKYALDEKALSTHVVTKVISYPAIQKSIRTLKDGIKHSEEYIAFNSETGEPAITIFADGFDNLDLQQSSDHNGTYASYTIPASKQYLEMGQKAANERLIEDSVGCSIVSDVVTFSTYPYPILYRGDVIKVANTASPSSNWKIYNVDSIAYSGSVLYLSSVSYTSSLSPTFGSQANIEVIRSGRTNQLSIPAGQITTYGLSKKYILDTLVLSNLTTNVIAASATTFSDIWPYDVAIYGAGDANANNYEKGIRGRWRPVKTYVYRQNIQSSVAASNDRIYKGGKVTSFSFFNWQNPTSSAAEWLAPSTVTKYSPHGEPIEEVDILGIPSAAKFTHQNMVPSTVAKNAEYTAISFQSFEDGRGGSDTTTTYAHSGKHAFKLTSGVWKTIDTLQASSRLRESGVSLKYWVKSSLASPCTVEISGLSRTPRFIAQTGEWKLFEATIGADTLSSTGSHIVKFQASGSNVYIDDVRLQPLDAQATCFVYDRATLRLLAQFDDQHFGLYFQYNGEGKLVRKIKETERGLKTVQEAQYHTPLVSRETSGNTLSLMRSPGTNRNRYINTIAPSYSPTDTPVNTDQGASGNIDMLNLELNPDRQQLQILGIDSLLAPAGGSSEGKNNKSDTVKTRKNK